MPSLVLIGAFFAFLLLLYQYVLYPTFLSPLSKIPNAHFSVPITSVWISAKRRGRAGTRTLYLLHKRCGPIVRLGPNEISVNTPDALRTIYKGGFEKTRWYQDLFVNYGTLNMVSMLEHKRHSMQKRMVSHVYSKSYLQDSSDLQFAANCLIFERFLPILNSVAAYDHEMDVFKLLQAVGMDFTSAYLFGLGNATNFMDDIKDRDHWLEDYKIFKSQLPDVRTGGDVEKLCMSLCDAAGTSMYAEKGDGTASASRPVVFARLSQAYQQMFGSKVETKEIMMKAIASELLDHLLAGHETSGITMSYLMYELSQRPELQDRLRKELLTLVPPIINRRENTPAIYESDNLPSPRSIDALPLLDSILQETLRLYAAAPGQQPRITPHTPQGTTIEGHNNIPGGVTVSSNAYTLHRNPAAFPIPLVWMPERWMDASPDRLQEMRRWFWAFGSGGRMCLGSNFAIQRMFLANFEGNPDESLRLTAWMLIVEMKLVVAAVYTNYTTEIVDAEGIEQADEFISGPVGEKLVLRFKHV